MFFPASSIKLINQYAITSYSIDFSDLDNSGNILNQDLKFFNHHIKHNDRSVLQLSELGIGITFAPQNFFQPVIIRNINIKDGYYNYIDSNEPNASFNSFVGFSNNTSFSFQNFEYKRANSIIQIDGIFLENSPARLMGS